MQLLIPFAAPPAHIAAAVLDGLALPGLDRLLGGAAGQPAWTVAQRDDGEDCSLSPPHERAQARRLGWLNTLGAGGNDSTATADGLMPTRADGLLPTRADGLLPTRADGLMPTRADGLLPFAAADAARIGAAARAPAWLRITPVHWSIDADGAKLLGPQALALDADEAARFAALLAPLFDEDGIVFIADAATAPHWLGGHADFARLPTASLDRVIGHGVEAWLPRRGAAGTGSAEPAARRLRRLQNEAQMLLHEHALNEAREARGALPLNSLWFSASGALAAPHGGSGALAAPRGSGAADGGIALPLRIDERLREPALAGDWACWQQRWRELDHELESRLSAAATSPFDRLVLSGQRSAVELRPQPAAGWRRLASRLGWSAAPRSGASHTLLESL